MPSCALGVGVNRRSRSPLLAVNSHSVRTATEYGIGKWYSIGTQAFRPGRLEPCLRGLSASQYKHLSPVFAAVKLALNKARAQFLDEETSMKKSVTMTLPPGVVMRKADWPSQSTSVFPVPDGCGCATAPSEPSTVSAGMPRMALGSAATRVVPLKPGEKAVF